MKKSFTYKGTITASEYMKEFPLFRYALHDTTNHNKITKDIDGIVVSIMQCKGKMHLYIKPQ